MAVLVDGLAKRYGKWPHEVLDLDPYQLSVALICAKAGQGFARGLQDRIERNRGVVFPVAVVGGL